MLTSFGPSVGRHCPRLGIAGNRACIGYRFALAEILLRDLEFTIDDDVVIAKRTKDRFFGCRCVCGTAPRWGVGFLISAPSMCGQVVLTLYQDPCLNGYTGILASCGCLLFSSIWDSARRM